MRGFVVIGTGPDAAEIEVAARLCAASKEAGLTPAAMVASAAGRSARSAVVELAQAGGGDADALQRRTFDGGGAPLVAARHAGVSIEPQALLAEARGLGEHADITVVATSGGLLGPLALRYTNRDLARELGLPLVVAVHAGDGFLNHAMLTLESAAGAGLPVAAVVVTGWPDPPDRVLRDERELLEQAAGVETLALEQGGPWPVRPMGRATPRPRRWAEPSSGNRRGSRSSPTAHGRSTRRATRARRRGRRSWPRCSR